MDFDHVTKAGKYKAARVHNEKFHLQKTVPPDRLDVDSDSCHPILPAVVAAQAPH